MSETSNGHQEPITTYISSEIPSCKACLVGVFENRYTISSLRFLSFCNIVRFRTIIENVINVTVYI